MNEWIAKIQRPHFIPSPSSKLCSEHFSEDCFDRTGQRVYLKKGSIPSIFLIKVTLISLFHHTHFLHFKHPVQDVSAKSDSPPGPPEVDDADELPATSPPIPPSMISHRLAPPGPSSSSPPIHC